MALRGRSCVGEICRKLTVLVLVLVLVSFDLEHLSPSLSDGETPPNTKLVLTLFAEGLYTIQSSTPLSCSSAQKIKVVHLLDSNFEHHLRRQEASD